MHYFDTPLGRAAIGWSHRGINRIVLPVANAGEEKETTGEVPAWVRKVAAKISGHLGGRAADFSSVKVDLEDAAPFHRKVYDAMRALERGRTLTYGELAAKLGAPGAARAVGQAMARNPVPILVPCHRILGANGSIGGFSAGDGLATKKRLLELEGVRLVGSGASLFDGTVQLGWDPSEALKYLRKADPRLGPLFDAVGPFRLQLGKMRSPFEALAQSIVYQQLSGKAAATILGRVVALYPGRRFPSPRAILETADETLRSAGLSGAKTRAIKDLAEKTLDGTVPPLRKVWAMSDAELIERLTVVRGVGQWTVEMMLIFRLGRPDILPIDDYGVRKGFARTYRKKALPTPKELLAHGERWRPYRTVPSWYFWRALEL